MFNRRYVVLGIVLVSFFGVFLARGIVRERANKADQAKTPTFSHATPIRIVSLSPSITETLFALGLGERVVGVTRFCDFPQEALLKSRIGGYTDINEEAIVALQPDLVVALEAHTQTRRTLEYMGIRTLVVEHQRVEDVLEAIRAIGEACGVSIRAQEITTKIRKRMADIQQRCANRPQPRVLIALGRGMGSDAIDRLVISGSDGFYHDLVQLAGGTNVYKGKTIGLPAVSAEAVVRLDPDIIIEIVPDRETDGYDPDELVRAWRSLPGLNAARRRIHILGGDHTVIPGPRLIQVLEDLARWIHPDAWTDDDA